MSQVFDVVQAPEDVRGRRLRSFGKALATGYTLTVANVTIYLVSVPLYLHWLGSGRFGLWLILLQLVWIASFVTSWIAAPIVREAAACHVDSDRRRLSRLVGTASLYYAVWGVIATTAGATVGVVLAAQVGLHAEDLGDARLATAVVSASCAVLMQLNLLLNVLTGYQRMHLSNLLLAAVTLLSAVLGLTFVSLGGGLAFVAIGHLVSASAVYLGAFLLVLRATGLELRHAVFDAGQLRALLTTGSGYFIYGISYLVLQSDILLVGVVLGAEAAAVYGVAFRAVDQIVQLVWKVPDSLIPLTAEVSARGELEGFQAVHRSAARATLGVALVAAWMVLFYGGPVLAIWVGSEHAADQPVLAGLSFVLLTQAFVHSSVVVPYGANRMGRIPIVTAIEALLKLALGLALLPALGMVGAVLATGIAQVVCTGWFVPRVACRLTGDSLMRFLRAAVAPLLVPSAGLLLSIGVIGTVVPSDHMRQWVGVFVTPLVYLALYLTFTVRRHERMWIRGALMRS